MNGASRALAISQQTMPAMVRGPAPPPPPLKPPEANSTDPFYADYDYVTEFFVTREKRATFRQVPGTAKLRPKAATGLPGLVLAGSWTDTGWPDTMEGAVRSGLNAAIALQESFTARAGATVRDPEVTEVNSEAKIEADEREVRS